MTEDLLTNQEIIRIQEFINQNPIYRNPNISVFKKFGRKCTTVLWVSPIKGVIFVAGNLDTGLDHIYARHNYWSTKSFWRKDIENTIDNPGRFQSSSMPYLNFSKIVDDLFEVKNVSIEKNKNSELFDVYEGESHDSDGVTNKFRLITYKNSSIVHSLFPLKGIKRKIVNLERRRAQGDLQRIKEETFQIFGTPYFDNNKKLVCAIQVEKNLDKKTERCLLLDADFEKGGWLIYERPLQRITSIDEEIRQMDEADLSEIEKIIKILYPKID